MNKEISAIKEIKEFVIDLKENLSLLSDENRLLNEKIKSLHNEKTELTAINNELNEKLKMLKLAKKLDGDGDTINKNKDVKLMINEMVREIDKCIGLLNK
jgi:cell shape-determining protein MreC